MLQGRCLEGSVKNARLPNLSFADQETLSLLSPSCGCFAWQDYSATGLVFSCRRARCDIATDSRNMSHEP